MTIIHSLAHIAAPDRDFSIWWKGKKLVQAAKVDFSTSDESPLWIMENVLIALQTLVVGDFAIMFFMILHFAAAAVIGKSWYRAEKTHLWTKSWDVIMRKKDEVKTARGEKKYSNIMNFSWHSHHPHQLVVDGVTKKERKIICSFCTSAAASPPSPSPRATSILVKFSHFHKPPGWKEGRGSESTLEALTNI